MAANLHKSDGQWKRIQSDNKTRAFANRTSAARSPLSRGRTAHSANNVQGWSLNGGTK